MTRSANDARGFLALIGLEATHGQCDDAVAVLLADGRRGKLMGGASGVTDQQINSFDARMGCERMLRRHLETGRHWISDPARMASALREAGMVRA